MVNKVKIKLGPNGIVFRGNGNGGKSTTNLGEAAKQVPVGKPKPDAKPESSLKPKPKSTPKPSQNTGNTSVGFLRKYFNPKTTGGKFRILGLALGLICTGMGFALMNSKKEAVPAEEYQLDREDSTKVRELSPDRELKQEQFEEIVAQHVQIQAEKEKEPSPGPVFRLFPSACRGPCVRNCRLVHRPGQTSGSPISAGRAPPASG